MASLKSQNVKCESPPSGISLASLITFMIGYSIGFATVPFILMGELLPARYRNLLGGIASR
jgi:facilitated trehalose transporter